MGEGKMKHRLIATGTGANLSQLIADDISRRVDLRFNTRTGERYFEVGKIGTAYHQRFSEEELIELIQKSVTQKLTEKREE